MKIMIAGASGGIGSFLTEKFDIESNELFLTYNTSKSKIYNTKKAKSTILQCNFTKKEEVKKVFSTIESLDVLINVMGHVENCLICSMEEEEWDRVIASNLKTVFLSCRYGIEKMVENGHIINISSILGSIGMIGATNYAASKGGVESFTRSFALECLHKRRVFVNAIALGYFKIGLGLELSTKIEALTKQKIPLKEFGESEEIYKLIKYIISSTYLVGQVIHLNGGLKL
ncbi:MAG: SDR family oxidoreductase [Candidatus Hermodarchaeota archaeon]